MTTLAVIALVTLLAPAADSPPVAAHFNCSVVEMGAKGDGEADDTDAFQRAMDRCAEDGGGVVHVPTGTYAIMGHLEIPPFVTLEGVWRSPQRGQRIDKGTTLRASANEGDANGRPFITLHENSTLKGVTIFYPNQKKTNPPKPYPWTIASGRFVDNCAIIDVTLVNPYQAVDFGTYPTGRHLVRNLYAHALHKGIYINQCFDVGRLENIHFWPFWDPDPASPLREYTRTNGTAFIIGRTDGEMAINCFSIFYAVAMHFINGPISDDSTTPHHFSPGSGVYTNCYMDITPCAVKVDSVMENAGISFVNSMFMSGIDVAPENRGEVKFTACGFWANSDQTWHAHLGGRGSVFFESCHFSEWDRVRQGAPCIDANCRGLVVTGCEFKTDRADHQKIRLGPRVHRAVITSNLMPGGVLVDDQTPPGADVQIALNAAGDIRAYVPEWIALGPFPNNETVPDEAHAPTRAGYIEDYLGAMGGEAAARLEVGQGVDAPPHGTVEAKAFPANPDGVADFKALYGEGNGTAYAFCYVLADAAQEATFELGSNDCSKVWVNGSLAHEYWSDTGDSSAPGTHVFTARLEAGRNPLLVKVEDAGGSRWELIVEVYGQDGAPLKTAVR